MAPVIHPGHIGLRSLGALGHHDDYPDYPDVDLDPIARFILVFVFSFMAITFLLVFLKLAGICLLACMIGCRNGPEERIVYRVSASASKPSRPARLRWTAAKRSDGRERQRRREGEG